MGKDFFSDACQIFPFKILNNIFYRFPLVFPLRKACYFSTQKGPAVNNQEMFMSVTIILSDYLEKNTCGFVAKNKFELTLLVTHKAVSTKIHLSMICCPLVPRLILDHQSLSQYVGMQVMVCRKTIFFKYLFLGSKLYRTLMAPKRYNPSTGELMFSCCNIVHLDSVALMGL